MKNLIATAVGLCLLVIPAITQEPKVDKYCVHLMWGSGDPFPAGHALSLALEEELERVMFQSNKYIRSSKDVKPSLQVEITIKKIDREVQAGSDAPEMAALSVAYVFFPGSTKYYAYSNCMLLDRERLERVVRGIEKEIEGVYDLHYHGAEDLKKIYDAHIKAEEEKLERMKKKGESE